MSNVRLRVLKIAAVLLALGGLVASLAQSPMVFSKSDRAIQRAYGPPHAFRETLLGFVFSLLVTVVGLIVFVILVRRKYIND